LPNTVYAFVYHTFGRAYLGCCNQDELLKTKHKREFDKLALEMEKNDKKMHIILSRNACFLERVTVKIMRC